VFRFEGASRGRLASWYFTLQGVAIVAWWLLLLLVPPSRALFLVGPLSETSFLGFWMADLAAASFSVATGQLIRVDSPLAGSISWVTVGLLSYAAYSVSASPCGTAKAGWHVN